MYTLHFKNVETYLINIFLIVLKNKFCNDPDFTYF